MSARLVGMVLEHYPGSGGELVLAICLADEAEHSGGNIRAAVPEMARLSRMHERNVRRLLNKMQRECWLELVEGSIGGRGKAAAYRINPDWVRLPVGFQFGQKPGHNPDKLSGFTGSKPGQNVRVSAATPFLVSSFTPPIPPQATGSAVPSDSGEVEDRRLAAWMLDRLRPLNPKHSEPNWKRWCREIRLMRQRDGRSHREIAELFAWANADPFWQTNILSPGKLRSQWDQLEIKRKAGQRKLAQQPDHATASPLCARCGERAWTIKHGTKANDPGYCDPCAEAIEQERAA